MKLLVLVAGEKKIRSLALKNKTRFLRERLKYNTSLRCSAFFKKDRCKLFIMPETCDVSRSLKLRGFKEGITDLSRPIEAITEAFLAHPDFPIICMNK